MLIPNRIYSHIQSQQQNLKRIFFEKIEMSKKRQRNDDDGAAGGDDDHSNFISIIVKNQVDQKEVYFRVKRDVPIRKVLLSYCEKMQVDYLTTVFLYNGSQVLRHHKTPAQLGMETGDEIDATTHMDGGGETKI